MPGVCGTDTMYYSWDLGPVHFIAYDTEAFQIELFNHTKVDQQLYWLEQDLMIANLPENRYTCISESLNSSCIISYQGSLFILGAAV